MAYLEKNLIIKKSLLPGAGMGLFTKVNIAKGTCNDHLKTIVCQGPGGMFS